jgi:hypothetical protein
MPDDQMRDDETITERAGSIHIEGVGRECNRRQHEAVSAVIGVMAVCARGQVNGQSDRPRQANDISCSRLWPFPTSTHAHPQERQHHRFFCQHRDERRDTSTNRLASDEGSGGEERSQHTAVRPLNHSTAMFTA